MTKLVIVESPAKAKTIGRFLGDGYIVEASYGHVRDLPSKADEIPEEVRGESWARLGVNTGQQFEPLYIVPPEKRRHIDRLKKAMKGVDTLLMATDEDREGESIVWHLLEVLKPDRKKVKVQRIAFHEITPEAIKHAVKNPRDLDENLVRAQETRRVLDRLYGYTLSPVLWKKVQSGLSAGRVQSVAVRLCVVRERERIAFHSSVYWDLQAAIETGKGGFKAMLTRLGDKRLASGRDFDPTTGQLKSPGDVLLLDESQATQLRDRCLEPGRDWQVERVEKKPDKARPAAPFITSTLQQEASRKLGFNAKRTMSIAQELYEGVDLGGKERVGLITYMRTDSVTLSDRALGEARDVIKQLYGKDDKRYILDGPRHYKSKARNAQEAHEAIRPTSLDRLPESLRGDLTNDQFKLYDLIWKRTLASQMPDAELMRTQVDIAVQADSKRRAIFQASGKEIAFPGFLRVYVEGTDDPAAELGDQEVVLPAMAQGQKVKCKALDALRHETQAPARYTEASLVKKLEEEGIGRPSTYASIMGTIVDRGYVFKKGNALVPTFTAFAVIDLLERHFGDLVDLGFTSSMEEDLDEISRGEMDWKDRLATFYFGDKEKPGLEMRVETEERRIEPWQYDMAAEGDVKIAIRVGRYGTYVQRADTSNDGNGGTVSATLPDDIAPADLTPAAAMELLAAKAQGPRVLGTDPETGRDITARVGRFGPYVEIAAEEGAGTGKNAPQPKRASIPAGVDPETVTLEQALTYLALPRILGVDAASGEEIKANVGRFGPYVVCGKEFRSLGAEDDVYKVSLERAKELLAQPKVFRRAAAAPGRVVGKHPKSGAEIQVRQGRFGPYVADGTTNANIPKNIAAETLTLEQAVELLAARALKDAENGGAPKKGKGRPGAKKAAPAKKVATAKPAAKKAPVKKVVATKAAPKTTAKPAAKKPAAKKAPARKHATAKAK